MHTRARFLAGSLTLLLAVACGDGTEEPTDDTTPSDTAAMTETTEGGEADLVATASTSQLTVTNPMPHAMVVSVEYDGGGSTELGTVPANGEQTFQVAASPGETVTLVARDEADTHSPRGTLVLEAQSSWTIQ